MSIFKKDKKPKPPPLPRVTSARQFTVRLEEKQTESTAYIGWLSAALQEGGSVFVNCRHSGVIMRREDIPRILNFILQLHFADRNQLKDLPELPKDWLEQLEQATLNPETAQ